MTPSSIFKQTYEGYLNQISDLDLPTIGKTLGFEMDSGIAKIACFNRTYQVGPGGIHDLAGKTPNLSVSVILCKYLLMCPGQVPLAQELMTFKDFRDAAPLIHFFSNSVQKPIAHKFRGNIDALEKACQALGGQPYKADLGYQLKYRFLGLPKVPVYLLFNDADEEFAAQCTLLFERSAQSYLDMESLAMLGSALAGWL